MILIYLTGAPSHLDMFDLKPEAPAEVRGTFQPIATRTPGMDVCEHLPKLAARSVKFGRTPKLGGNVGTPCCVPDGRDHWGGVFFALFAGAGVRGGQVIGSSDNIVACPASNPCCPSDLGATIFSSLGIDPHSIIEDRVNRPSQRIAH